MHEIGVLYETVKLADKVAKENNIPKIKFLTLEIGELTGYLPVFFTEYFPIVAEDFDTVKDAKVNIEIVKGEALCNECHSLYNVMKNEGVCPKCKSRDKKILGGQDFLLKEIGY